MNDKSIFQAEKAELTRKFDEKSKAESIRHEALLHTMEEDYDSRIREIISKYENELNITCDELEREKQNTQKFVKSKEQWESYLGNIVQWVYDEKDARSYLETLANKMQEELENLRQAKNSQLPLHKLISTPSAASISASAVTGNNSEHMWRTLRKNKEKKQQLLELQSTLQEEIQLRHQISSDLTLERQNNQRLEHENTELRVKLQELLDIQTAHEQNPVRNHHSIEERASSGRSGSPAPSLSHSNEARSTYICSKPQILSMNDPSLYDIPTNSSILSSSSSMSSKSQLPHVDSRPKEIQRSAPAQHDWLLKTFPEPTQCMSCATYLTGIYRQGIFCQKCGYSCHYKCSKNVPGVCPLPVEDLKKRTGAHTVNLQGNHCT